MRFHLPIAIVVAAVGLLPVSQIRADSKATDAFISHQMNEAGIVGLGAAIIVDKKVIWAKGYGFADRAKAVPFTPDTVMNIGSISKTVLAVAMMQAIQDGKLALDVDINRYLPFKLANPFYPNDVITLRQLATHTSSITDRWSVYQNVYHYDGMPEPLSAYLQAYFAVNGAHYARENFLNHKPGSYREYTNIGAALAGYIVERAVGETLASYSKRTIFSPLQMRHTSWSLADIEPGQHSTLYVAQDGLSIPIPRYQLTTYPDGGLRTSVNDLSKLFIALLDGGIYQQTRILAEASAAEMLRFHYTAANKPDNVELHEKNSGLFWSTKFNVTRIGHGGSDPGLRTEMMANLSQDIGVVLFSNTSLSGEANQHYGAIFAELWKQAEAAKRDTATLAIR